MLKTRVDNTPVAYGTDTTSAKNDRELDEDDRLDLETARAALRGLKESGDATIPIDEVKRRLGTMSTLGGTT